MGFNFEERTPRRDKSWPGRLELIDFSDRMVYKLAQKKKKFDSARGWLVKQNLVLSVNQLQQQQTCV